MYENYFADNRILESMPFSFYYTPYLVMTPNNYHPLEYYEKLIEIFELAASGKLMVRRVSSTLKRGLKAFHILRTFAIRDQLSQLRTIRGYLKTDPQFRDFHEGRLDTLPEFYHRIYRKRLGRYADLITETEMRPVLEPISSSTSLQRKSI